MNERFKGVRKVKRFPVIPKKKPELLRDKKKPERFYVTTEHCINFGGCKLRWFTSFCPDHVRKRSLK